MIKLKKTTGYISKIDLYLDEFDTTHPLSDSQVAEIKKYQGIAQLRDHSIAKNPDQAMWEEF